MGHGLLGRRAGRVRDGQDVKLRAIDGTHQAMLASLISLVHKVRILRGLPRLLRS
jgi:hypothetical protein